MEKPALQYERTILSWWRTLLSSVVVVAAVSKLGIKTSSIFITVLALGILVFTVVLSFFQTMHLDHNVKREYSLTYGPFSTPKLCLSFVLVLSALSFGGHILLSDILSVFNG